MAPPVGASRYPLATVQEPCRSPLPRLDWPSSRISMNSFSKRTRQTRIRAARCRDQDLLCKLKAENVDLKTIVTDLSDSDTELHDSAPGVAYPSSSENGTTFGAISTLWQSYKVLEVEIVDCKVQMASMMSAEQVDAYIKECMKALIVSGEVVTADAFASMKQRISQIEFNSDSVIVDLESKNCELMAKVVRLEYLEEKLKDEHSWRKQKLVEFDKMQDIQDRMAARIKDLENDTKIKNVTSPISPGSSTPEHLLKSQIKRQVVENKALKSELVELKGNFNDKVMASSSAYLAALLNSVELPSKDHGIVIGVISDPELNGVVVHVKEWVNCKCRWHATTLTGRDILLKTDNILRHRDFDQMSESSNSDFAGT